MEAALGVIAAWLDAVGVGPWARATPNVYPIANVLHLFGLVMLVGGIGVVDLRLAGLWRALPAAALARALTPVAVAGILVLAASGTVLFAADGEALARSGTFHWKLALIGIALANAVLFRLRFQKRLYDGEAISAGAAVLAVGSVLLWLTVATFGRMIAYS